MKFTIALYGSFNDSVGYTWKLPRGYAKGQFDNIIRNFTTQYSDGRKLGDSELYGGYYIDLQHDLFYAYRFINGGQDGWGRSGVVITNWAITRYSNVVGKDLRALFDNLTLKQMPLEDCIEVPLQGVFCFGNLRSSSLFGTERVLGGEDAKTVFQLPDDKCHRNILVQFTMTENQKKASIKFLSSVFKAPKKIGTQPYAKPQEKSFLKEVFTNLSTDFPYKIIFRAMLIIVFAVCIFVGKKMLFEKKDLSVACNPSGKTPNPTKELQSSQGSQSPKGTQSSQASKLPEKSVKTKIKQGSWTTWTPFYAWKSKDCEFKKDTSDKKNHYSWGELRVNQSKVEISFAAHITLENKDEEKTYYVLSGDGRIGKLEFLNNGWTFSFRCQDNSNKERELSSDFSLYDLNGQKKCGELLIRGTSISLKLFPLRTD